MKTLITLIALTALPTLAQANLKTLSQITLDLDRDGKPDTVSIVEKARIRDPQTFSRILKVTLSSRKHGYSYPDILMDVSSRDPEQGCFRAEAERPENVSLKLVAKGNSFSLGQVFEACNVVVNKEFLISLRNGKLMMDSMEQFRSHTTITGHVTSYGFKVDFRNLVASEVVNNAPELDLEESSVDPSESGIYEASWIISQDCSLGLTEMMKTTLADEMSDGRPACARNPKR